MREKGGKKLNILVCDDDKEIVEAIEIYLQQEGYQVFRAYDGEDALKILKDAETGRYPRDLKDPRGEQHPDHNFISEIRGYGQDTGVKRRGGRLHYQTV